MQTHLCRAEKYTLSAHFNPNTGGSLLVRLFLSFPLLVQSLGSYSVENYNELVCKEHVFSFYSFKLLYAGAEAFEVFLMLIC